MLARLKWEVERRELQFQIFFYEHNALLSLAKNRLQQFEGLMMLYVFISWLTITIQGFKVNKKSPSLSKLNK
jgi:hypothetical protein